MGRIDSGMIENMFIAIPAIFILGVWIVSVYKWYRAEEKKKNR